MISLVKRNKRPIIIFLITLFLFFSGLVLLEQEVEITGGLFFFSALITFFYGPFSWVLNRYKYIQITESWKRKEVEIGLVLFGLFNVLGAIESWLTHPEYIWTFILLLVFTGIVSLLHIGSVQTQQQGFTKIDKKKVGQLAFWCFTLGVGIQLIIFDSYGQEDALAITGLSYFPILIYLTLRWIFKQISLLLNLKNEQAKTELLHLKSQVNPHFFFNTLNNLYGLVEKDSKKARHMILQLSDMMRYSIYEGQKEKVFLEEEVTYLKNYIGLHRMRYHKDIEVIFKADIQEKELKIMPLMFIILLENAFKHGVENLIKDPYVHVNISANEKGVHFKVENNFDIKMVSNQPGIGLKNLKRRLELVYPNKHQLSFLATKNIYKAHLSIKP